MRGRRHASRSTSAAARLGRAAALLRFAGHVDLHEHARTGRVARQLVDRARTGRSNATARRAARASAPCCAAAARRSARPVRDVPAQRGRLGDQLLGPVLAEVALTAVERGARARRAATVFETATRSTVRAFTPGRPRGRVDPLSYGGQALGDAVHGTVTIIRPAVPADVTTRNGHLPAGHAVAAVGEVSGRSAVQTPQSSRSSTPARAQREPHGRGEVERGRAVAWSGLRPRGRSCSTSSARSRAPNS